MRRVHPLDPLRSIKVKLGVVIVATVIGTVMVLVLGRRAGLDLEWRVLLAAALGLAMVQFLARGMTSPLRDMAAASSAMARGDYGRRVRATSRDEVGELARAFNAMAADLADVERMRRDLVANVAATTTCCAPPVSPTRTTRTRATGSCWPRRCSRSP